MYKIISHSFIGVFLAAAFVLFTSRIVSATEEYAAQTGQKCAECHLDPAGGGELNAGGKAFAATLHNPTERSAIAAATKVFRLMIGYIHILTGFFWFGTILYVHLVLKPAYASSGLPRGELRVGVLSMIIMGVSGTILTCYRITSLDTLLHTRFGILLLTKISLFLLMVISAAFVIIVIGPKLKAKRREPLAVPTSGELTPEVLAGCDGKEGHPAYFAYEGKIYDVTQSKLWKQGVHMGRHNAGTDLTDALKHPGFCVYYARWNSEFL